VRGAPCQSSFDFGFGSAHGWSTLVCQLIGDGEESVDLLAAQFGAQQVDN
jgi:hypothetical protein